MEKESGKIYEAIIGIMSDMPAISKDRTAQGYKFRGIDDIIIVLNPLLVKYGVFITPKIIGEIKREERESKSGGSLFISIVTMSFTFHAADGSSIESITVGEAMDSSDKSCNKAMSAAFKYALLQTLAIPTDEPKDSEVDTHETKSFYEIAKETIPKIAINSDLDSWYKDNEKKFKMLDTLKYNELIELFKKQRKVITDTDKPLGDIPFTPKGQI